MVVLGGMASLPGVILGAAIVVGLPEVFRDFQLYRLLAFGLMLMVLMIFRPSGLLASSGKHEDADPAAPTDASAETGLYQRP